jgi:signal transduction histidine kinase
MRLAEFILKDIEAILVDWEAFAATRLPAAAQMGSLALRDHAAQILEAIAKDLQSPQTRQEQTDKSLGLTPVIISAPATAAETHAILRARSGFDINQLAAEYRALRASVLRRWTDACDSNNVYMDDLIRFNEAIDQALAESVNFFSKKVDESRNLLLGMLGHDMRNPLATIQATSSYLSMLNAGGAVTEAADRLMRSGARIKALLDDLLDFNRTNLGLGISINPCPLDLAAVFSDEIDQLRAANPGRSIELQVKGDLRGVWDGFRVQQVLANLVINALKYSTPDTPVFVTIIGEKDEVRFDVKNTGPAIEQSTLNWIFDPLKRAAVDEHQQRNESLGLGLYIARQICKSHGGDIRAQSSNAQTVFSVLLPRDHESLTARGNARA